MSEWQPIETAPKDGRLILSFWQDVPVLIAWADLEPDVITCVEGIWPFRRHRVTNRVNRGWRVAMLGPNLTYGIHGNYPPYTPSQWLGLDASTAVLDVEEEPAA